MLSVIRPVVQVLLAAALLEAALSAISPAIGVHMLRLQAPTELIGLASSAYFGGFLLGTLGSHLVIDRVGHIRAYSALAVVAANAALLLLMVPEPWLWVLFRALQGYAMAGLFIVIESWLNDKASSETRGRILAAYMVVSWGASVVGPLVLNIPDPDGRILFGLGALLLSLSLIPMALTRIGNPEIRDRAHFGILRLWRISPLGVLACFGSGLITSSFWGLLPVYIEDVGLEPRHLSIVLSLGTLGGLIVQIPTGWLADRLGRRPLILVQTSAAAAVAVAIALLGGQPFALLVILSFMFCMLFGPLYALGVAQTNDYISRSDFVAASSGLLLAWGIGSITGPLIAAPLIRLLGGRGLFLFLAVALACIAGFVVLRMRSRPPQAQSAPFVAVPASTGPHGAPELDPRSEPGTAGHAPPDPERATP
jgi:MFS family permease